MCLRKVATSRPSLSRVCCLLTEIVTKPQFAGSASSMNTLAHAAAHVSTEEQKIQAREASEKRARSARLELAKCAHEILKDNVERLCGKVHSQAANVKRDNKGRRDNVIVECQLGSGKLFFSLSKYNFVEPGLFSHSSWDVVAYSQISVNQVEPHYNWSASLWFAKLRDSEEYRWYEASYWRIGGYEFEPHALLPGADADFAASNIVHSVHFAFGPIAIDDDKEDEFHDRWIWLFSKAALGQLSRPSQTPYGWPPPLS